MIKVLARYIKRILIWHFLIGLVHTLQDGPKWLSALLDEIWWVQCASNKQTIGILDCNKFKDQSEVTPVA